AVVDRAGPRRTPGDNAHRRGVRAAVRRTVHLLASPARFLRPRQPGKPGAVRLDDSGSVLALVLAPGRGGALGLAGGARRLGGSDRVPGTRLLLQDERAGGLAPVHVVREPQ